LISVQPENEEITKVRDNPLTKTRGIIVFVGPVAAGKTTLMLSVRSFFKKSGQNVVCAFQKTYLETTMKPIMRLSPQSYYLVYRRIFRLLALLDLIVLSLRAAILFVLSRFIWVFVEDYYIGTLHDYEYISRIYLRQKSVDRNLKKIAFACLIAFRPTYVVYLDTDLEESRGRQEMRGDLKPEYDSYVEFQLRFLRYFATLAAKSAGSKLSYIDTNHSTPQQESAELVKHISRDQHG
jgi:thymidylate kinase